MFSEGGGGIEKGCIGALGTNELKMKTTIFTPFLFLMCSRKLNEKNLKKVMS